jgi:Zn-finger nucleic acid-binding protein
MLVLEFELVEVDYCPECSGVWLDSGELELVGRQAGALCGELEAALTEQGGRSPAGGSKRPCPVCRKGLHEVTTDSTPPIVLDCCPRGHGLWFDRGELSSVVAAAGADEDNLLARFFAELGGAASPKDNT